MPAPAPTTRPRIFRTAVDFRGWLEKYHDTAGELWVGYYRKGVPKRSMSYAEAVEEALCFGWIDGIGRRIDDEVHANRFTPRRRGSSWSAVNIAKIADLKTAGRMHPAGLRVFDERDRRKDAIYSYERPAQELPPELLARLRSDARAWAHWESRTPSHRRAVIFWIESAKRPETRERRFSTLLEEGAAGRDPRPFLVTRVERAAKS